MESRLPSEINEANDANINSCGAQAPSATIASLPWTELDRQEARDPDFASEPIQREVRWWITARRLPQVDA